MKPYAVLFISFSFSVILNAGAWIASAEAAKSKPFIKTTPQCVVTGANSCFQFPPVADQTISSIIVQNRGRGSIEISAQGAGYCDNPDLYSVTGDFYTQIVNSPAAATSPNGAGAVRIRMGLAEGIDFSPDSHGMDILHVVPFNLTSSRVFTTGKKKKGMTRYFLLLKYTASVSGIDCYITSLTMTARFVPK